MLIVDYQSKSYVHFLNDMPTIAKHKTRFLITCNGATESELAAVTEALVSCTQNEITYSNAISEKAPAETVTSLFTVARSSRDILLFENADVLFDKRTALKNSHGRDDGFDLNNLFKNIAKHNGIVLLATDQKQTLNASMSTKVDVLIRFPNI